MRNQPGHLIDDQIADYLSAWSDVEVNFEEKQRVIRMVSYDLRISRNISSDTNNHAVGLNILFALAGFMAGFILLVLTGFIPGFYWDQLIEINQMLFSLPVVLLVLACAILFAPLLVLILKPQNLEVE